MEVETVIQKLKKEFDENINSHIFLVETNDIEKSISDIKNLLKEILSHGDEIIKNQIVNETYLELIILRSEGKTIKTDRVFELQSRIKTKPVLSNFIAYIIAPAEDLNDSASNKLLKTIEEPNPNIIGFLVTKNADLLLPTIKSRCENITLLYDQSENCIELNAETEETIKSIIRAIEEKDHLALHKAKNSNKNLKENAHVVENLIKDYYNMACNLKTKEKLDQNLVDFIKKNNDYKTLIRKTKYINGLLNKLSKNMNIDLMLEKMFFDMKEVKKNDDSSRS